MRFFVLSLAFLTTVVLFQTRVTPETNQPAFPLEAANITPNEPLPAVCFSPDTPQSYVDQVNGLLPQPPEGFRFGSRWSTTATDGGGLNQGDPTVITWGLVDDGLSIPGAIGEPVAPSNLRARLNEIYPGGEAEWFPIFEQIWDEWASFIGVTYVYEPNDDGAPIFDSPGVVGVRPDVRIGGHLIDGNSGVLAYNFFPNNGDMVLDTADNFFENLTMQSLGMRNVLAHEHGHGMGIRHVCPVQQTKLMEPFVSFAFDGPQHDDVLTSNRLYGDREEPNDIAADATDLGMLGEVPTEINTLSIDDAADPDFFAIDLEAGAMVSATLTPVGFTYLEGQQNPDGTCTAGTNFNSLVFSDLGFDLVDRNGTSVLTSVDVNGPGGVETLTDFSVGSAGTYYLRVFGDANQVQLYNLQASAEAVLVPVCVYEELLAAWNATSQPCLLGNVPSVLDLVAALD